MTTVNIQPLPAWARDTRFKPMHPPIFSDGDPSPADRALAQELFEALDAESQRWYSSSGALFPTTRTRTTKRKGTK